MALAKLGLTALLLSVNNSVPAIAHLCKLTKASHLIYGSKFPQEAKEAQDILRQQGVSIGLVEDKRFPLWGPEGVEASKIKPFAARLTPDQEKDRPAVVLHSSGSVSACLFQLLSFIILMRILLQTGFPKPVYVTHYGLIANVAMNQNKPGFSTLPVYHGYGHFAMYAALPVLSLYNPSNPNYFSVSDACIPARP